MSPGGLLDTRRRNHVQRGQMDPGGQMSTMGAWPGYACVQCTSIQDLYGRYAPTEHLLPTYVDGRITGMRGFPGGGPRFFEKKKEKCFDGPRRPGKNFFSPENAGGEGGRNGGDGLPRVIPGEIPGFTEVCGVFFHRNLSSRFRGYAEGETTEKQAMNRKREWYVTVWDAVGDNPKKSPAFERADIYGPYTETQAAGMKEAGAKFPRGTRKFFVFRATGRPPAGELTRVIKLWARKARAEAEIDAKIRKAGGR